jgi:hypothetical protein
VWNWQKAQVKRLGCAVTNFRILRPFDYNAFLVLFLICRCVDVEERSFALGMQSFLARAMGKLSMCFDIIADVEIKGNPRKCLKRALGNRAL